MKRISLMVSILSLAASTVFSQVTPNSIRFDIGNYIAIDNNGKYAPYNAHGFYENASTTTANVFILPNLKLDLTKIKFIGTNGLETSRNTSEIRSIIIPVTINLSLPNESQKAGIIANIKGNTTIQAFYPPVVKNANGYPVLHPMVSSNPVLTQQLIAMVNQYEANAIIPQQQLINDYNTRYRTQIISLTEFEIIVEAGDEVVYSKRYPGTWIGTGGTLKNITIEHPTEYVRNLIAQGNGQILVSYKFRDSKLSKINANINATAIVDQYLNEAFQNSVSQRSSGWSFLGFGSSKKSVKNSMNQQVSQQASTQSIANTTIEMYDADDYMINQFESAFFPNLSQQQTIQNHITAAEKAKAEGNTQLMDLHLKYAESLQKNDPNLTPNIEAAVAALGKKDYVGFIANGVRWGNNSANGNTSYRRVLNSHEMSSMASNWNSTKVVSLQHAVTQPVLVSQEAKFRPSLGAIDAMPFQNNLLMLNGYMTQSQNVRGVIIGPITAGGAMQRNNIYPGTLMTRIGNYPVYSGQTVTEALSHYEAGESIYITLIVPIPTNINIYQEQRVQVTLDAYPAITSN